jgi:hypothetical protein
MANMNACRLSAPALPIAALMDIGKRLRFYFEPLHPIPDRLVELARVIDNSTMAEKG